ncbi:TolC family protein [Poseidonibacter lekithochrous]|uniref:TolC family protein n=1 Tax=Poseidonibacter lekithochrous TaxID=1904463 RepID=UPI0008FC5A6E|nr:TolC family protein [Poseidonibacter lekithochrous]QKJ21499.1 RND family efflux system, outer membrane channel protein, TolC family [Poseidonibacter lekithochrous]
MRRSKTILLSLSAAVFITGCSIKPEPLLPKDIKSSVKKDLQLLSNIVKPITKAITLEEAIDRAVNNNIRNRVQKMESALAYKQIDMVYYDMLPSLAANAGYSVRDNYAASASTSFTNGQPDQISGTPSYSVSQDKERTTTDVSFNWNILDFGLSYVRAKQQSDKYLMAKENEKKVTQNIIQEVRRTYYQTVSADALLKRIVPMKDEVKDALVQSRKVKLQRVSSPMEALSYQRELLEVLRSLQSLERNLMNAKLELSELMGLKPGTKFELSEKVRKNYDLPEIKMALEDMEKVALENRPEVLESRYKERISSKETTTAILKMLPGINLNAGINYNDSDYLLNNDWASYGASVSWNLINIFKGNTYNKIAKTQIELAKEQKLAVSMAVLSQVHLSIVNFKQAKKEYELSKEYLDVAEEIFNLTEVGNDLNMNSRLVFIKEKLNYILSTLRHSSSYANVQNSYGRIFASLGTYSDMKKEEVKAKKVEKKLVKKIMPAVEKKEMKSPTFKTYGIATSNLNVRAEASLDSEVKYVLEKNKKVEILKTISIKNDVWSKIEDGYVSSTFLEIQTTEVK